MRWVPMGAAIVAVVALLATPAEASRQHQRKHKQVFKPAHGARILREEPRGNNPNEPSSWRVGSTEWWRAMSYQGRAGRRF